MKTTLLTFPIVTPLHRNCVTDVHLCTLLRIINLCTFGILTGRQLETGIRVVE